MNTAKTATEEIGFDEGMAALREALSQTPEVRLKGSLKRTVKSFIEQVFTSKEPAYQAVATELIGMALEDEMNMDGETCVATENQLNG